MNKKNKPVLRPWPPIKGARFNQGGPRPTPQEQAAYCQELIERVYVDYATVLDVIIGRARIGDLGLCIGSKVPPWILKRINERLERGE